MDSKQQAQLLKKFNGKLSAATEIPSLERKQTGIAGLDYITCGGIPIGRVMMLYGPNGVGKSTLALELAKVFIEDGGVAYIDAEKTVTAQDFSRLQIDPAQLLVLRPDYAEEAVNFLLEVSELGFKFVVIDSVPALLPKSKEERLEENVAAGDVGTQARFFSGVQPLLIKAVSTGMTICFINQLRSNFNTYGPKTSLPGGAALPYLCSLMLDLSSNKKVTDAESNTIRTKITSTKNKGGFKDLSTEIEVTATGVNRISSTLDTAKDLGIIETKGSWVYLEESFAKSLNMNTQLAQGISGAYKVIRDNSDLCLKINQQILNKIPSV